jgi:hypothetical protein
MKRAALAFAVAVALLLGGASSALAGARAAAAHHGPVVASASANLPIATGTAVANLPIAIGDVGSMGGLTPDAWGLPYRGDSAAMGLFMASAGVVLRMLVNVVVIYAIYTYWMGDDDSPGRGGKGRFGA